jgi:hypothetical protein
MLWSQYKLATIRHTEFLRKEITGILSITNRNSNFLTLQTLGFQKKNPTGIFRIKNKIGIPLTMGVAEIGTKNWNSQPRLAFSRRLPRTSSQRKGKRLSFLLHIAVNWATLNIAVINIATIIEATNVIAMIDNLTIIIETIGATNALNATTRTWGASSPMTRRMIASAITTRKIVTRPCTMTSPQALAIRLKEGVNLVLDHLHALVLVLVLSLAFAQAAEATATIMLIKTTTSLVQHPSKSIYPSTGTRTPPRVMTADAFIARTKVIMSLPSSPLQRQRRSAPRNRELHQ